MARSRGRPARIPPHLEDAVGELVELAIDSGPLDLGHGAVIAADLKPDCRCKCAYSAFIKGAATLRPGQTETYGLDTPVGHVANAGCHDCKHTGTDWTSGGTLAGSVTLDKKKLLSVEVKVKNDAANGTFTLTATPKGECKCVGTNAVVTCEPLADTVSIEVKKS